MNIQNELFLPTVLTSVRACLDKNTLQDLRVAVALLHDEAAWLVCHSFSSWRRQIDFNIKMFTWSSSQEAQLRSYKQDKNSRLVVIFCFSQSHIFPFGCVEKGENIYGTQSTKFIFIIRYFRAISSQRVLFTFSATFVLEAKRERRKSIPQDHPWYFCEIRRRALRKHFQIINSQKAILFLNFFVTFGICHK